MEIKKGHLYEYWYGSTGWILYAVDESRFIHLEITRDDKWDYCTAGSGSFKTLHDNFIDHGLCDRDTIGIYHANLQKLDRLLDELN